MNRREVLELGLSASMLFLTGGRMIAQRLTSARDAVDHLLLGCADLQRGIAWVEARTGVRAAIGGSHPGRGTRNALLGLDGRQYLEIIAPDPTQAGVPRPELSSLQDPRLIGWASDSRDLATLVRTARAAGVQMSDPQDGSRQRPDGRTVRWRTAEPDERLESDGISPVPFFIEWAADALHPSADSPAGCRLTECVFEHPRPGALQDQLKRLGIDATVADAPRPALVARLVTAKGTITIR